jgi:hypothetical protein
MPSKERSVMEERMRFVLHLKDGESMAFLKRFRSPALLLSASQDLVAARLVSIQ